MAYYPHRSYKQDPSFSSNCFILGPEKGIMLVEATPGMEAVFIDDQGNVYFSQG